MDKCEGIQDISCQTPTRQSLSNQRQVIRQSAYGGSFPSECKASISGTNHDQVSKPGKRRPFLSGTLEKLGVDKASRSTENAAAGQHCMEASGAKTNSIWIEGVAKTSGPKGE